jgi:uncharacterized delta-60 repeat protein
MQPGGQVVVAGDSGGNFALARYRPDGELDTAFGSAGRVLTDFGGADSAQALVAQSDGSLVAAGRSDGDFALARYRSDGTLDTSFGTGGRVRTDFGGDDTVRALVVQPDGRLVAAGYSAKPGGTDVVLARYAADGTPDSSFGAAGRVVTDFGRDDFAEALVIQPGDRLVIAGQSNGDFVLARYRDDGGLDTAFGNAGRVTTDFGAGDSAHALAVQADGRLVAAGYSCVVRCGFALARYGVDGDLDTAFGGDGRVTTDFGGDGFARALAVQSDGKLVAAGYSYSVQTGWDFALARYADREPPTSVPTDTPTPTVTPGPPRPRMLVPVLVRDGTPGPAPTPLAADDFSTDRLHWPVGAFGLSGSGYAEGGYRIMVRRGPYYATGLIDVGVPDWTVTVDLRLDGANPVRRAGIAFGSSTPSCNAASVDCYRLYVSSDGATVLDHQGAAGAERDYASAGHPPVVAGAWHRLRVDRMGTRLAAWLSADGGRTWREVTVPRPQLATGAARGTWVGVAAAAEADDPGGAEALFDNFALWRYGDVPPP